MDDEPKSYRYRMWMWWKLQRMWILQTPLFACGRLYDGRAGRIHYFFSKPAF